MHGGSADNCAGLHDCYNSTVDRVVPVDCSFNRTFNYSQMAVSHWITYLLPPVAWVAGHCPNGIDFHVKNNQPGAFVRLLTVGGYTQPGGLCGGANCWQGDTLNGNPEEWYVAGDEAIHFFADITYPSSDWKCKSCKPSLRQRFEGSPQQLVNTTVHPAGVGTFVDTGVQGNNSEWLQSGSSREKIHFQTTVGSSVPGDILYFSIWDSVSGNLTIPGSTNGVLRPKPIPLANTPYDVDFTYEVSGGTLEYPGMAPRGSYLNSTSLCPTTYTVSAAIYGVSSVHACGTYTLAPQLYKLRMFSGANATTYVGNVGGQQFPTSSHAEEFSVD